MALTQVGIRNTKPREKAYKLADEKGLFLFVTPSGGKYWRFKYRFGGKEKKLAFGVYPEISLAEARERRDQARKLLTNDVDPGIVKQATKNAIVQATENSFQLVAQNGMRNFLPSGWRVMETGLCGDWRKMYFRGLVIGLFVR